MYKLLHRSLAILLSLILVFSLCNFTVFADTEETNGGEPEYSDTTNSSQTGSENSSQGTDGTTDSTGGSENSNQGTDGTTDSTGDSENSNQGTDGTTDSTGDSENSNQGTDGTTDSTGGSEDSNQGTDGTTDSTQGGLENPGLADGSKVPPVEGVYASTLAVDPADYKYSFDDSDNVTVDGLIFHKTSDGSDGSDGRVALSGYENEKNDEILPIPAEITVAGKTYKVDRSSTYNATGGYLIYALNSEENTANLRATLKDLSGDVTVPEKISVSGIEYTVTEAEMWSDAAFSHNNNITSVSLPGSIEEVATSFQSCRTLKSVSFGEGTTVIDGNMMFSGCDALTTVNLPSTLTTIGYAAFDDASALTDIQLPEGLNEIEGYAFKGCAALQEIQLPEGLTVLGEGAFQNCSSLESIAIPAGLNSIEEYTFDGCSKFKTLTVAGDIVFGTNAFSRTGLTSVEVEGSASVGDYAFYYCSNLEKFEVGGTALVGDSAFRYCSRLKTFEVESISAVGNSAFSNCKLLASIPLGGGIKAIGDNAFSSCQALSAIEIPESVTEIGERAFYGTGLTSLTFAGDSQLTSVGGYAFASTMLTDVTLPESLSAVSNSMFAYCEKLSSVKLSETLTDIGEKAFYSCVKLSVEIPQSVLQIGNDAFYQCAALTSIEIPSGVKVLGDGVFQECTALETVSLPEGLTSIGYRAFQKCTALETVTLPEGLTSIGGSAFQECSKLTSIRIPDGVTTLENNVFYQCTALEEAQLPDGLTVIGNSVFYKCENLKTADLPAELTSIGSKAFYGCVALAVQPVFPEGLSVIGDNAFWNCNSLKEIVLPNSLVKIGDRAFRYCYFLKDVTIGTGITQIGQEAFDHAGDKADSPLAVKIEVAEKYLTVGSNAFPKGANLSYGEAVPFTEAGLQERINNAADEEIVTIDVPQDVYLEKGITIPAGKQIVLHTDKSRVFYGASSVATAFTVEEGASLTIGSGITLELSTMKAGAANSGVAFNVEGNLVMEDGSAIRNASNQVSDSGIINLAGDGASFTMDGGEISGTELGKYGKSIARIAVVQVRGGAEFTMNGGMISGYRTLNGGCHSSGILLINGGTAVMNGGEISGCGFPKDLVGGGYDLVAPQYTGTVVVRGGGDFTMTGGQIKNNMVDGINSCPGVLLDTGSGDADFTMAGGEISGNQGWMGGGVLAAPVKKASKATFTMNDGTISGNTVANRNSDDKINTAGGGGVYVMNNASFIMNGGEISGNHVENGMGGGVATYDGYASPNGHENGTLESWSKKYPAEFVFNGGTISGNSVNGGGLTSGAGGGIYVGSGKCVLNGGTISDNTASIQGGGVYVACVPYVLQMYNVLVTENSADSLGGGLWFCPTGDVSIYLTDGGAAYGNKASGAGDDFVHAAGGGLGTGRHSVTLSDWMMGGGATQWYPDGVVGEGSGFAGGNADPNAPRYGADGYTGQRLYNISDNTKRLALKSVSTEDARNLAAAAAALVITGNSAPRGGGIGSNGGVIIGTPDDETENKLIVKKQWSKTPEDKVQPVTVFLKFEDKIVDQAVLNKDNDWTFTFEGLPNSAEEYTVEEATPGSFETKYEISTDENGVMVILITNTYNSSVKPGGGGGGGNNPVPPTEEPPVTIPEDPIPGGEIPGGGISEDGITEDGIPNEPVVTIPEEPVPAGELPKTGGFSLEMLAPFGCAFLLIGLFLRKKERKNN